MRSYIWVCWVCGTILLCFWRGKGMKESRRGRSLQAQDPVDAACAVPFSSRWGNWGSIRIKNLPRSCSLWGAEPGFEPWDSEVGIPTCLRPYSNATWTLQLPSELLLEEHLTLIRTFLPSRHAHNFIYKYIIIIIVWPKRFLIGEIFFSLHTNTHTYLSSRFE